MLALVLFLLLFSISLISSAPINITIGGLFNPFQLDGTVDQDQVDNAVAFLMAIKEINYQQDLIHFDYVIRSGHESIGAISAALQLSNMDVFGVVGSLPNGETMAVDKFFADKEIVMIHSMANDSDLGNGGTYPFKAQVVPIESYQSSAFHNLLCEKYGMRRSIVFATNDEFGTQASSNLFSELAFCNITNLGTYLFSPYTTDFSGLISQAMTTRSTIFVLFMGTQNAANLLEQGFNYGLFREGTQIFGSSLIATNEIRRYFTRGVDVEAIMNGFIGLQYWPDYAVTRSPEGILFLDSWRNFSVEYTVNSTTNYTDMTGNHFLCRNSDISQPCAGVPLPLNLTAMIDANANYTAPTGDGVGAYAALTYDATTLLAAAIFKVVQHANGSISGQDIYDAVLNTSFVGASGVVQLSLGDPNAGYYGRGDRIAGIYYDVINYVPEAYYVNDNDSFVEVGSWGSSEGFVPCDINMTSCWEIVYNTLDNLPPSAYPPYAFDMPPTVVKIGGLFEPFNSDGTVNNEQAQMLGVFLLAIEEINNKNDGIYDHLLPNTQLKYAVGYGVGYTATIKSVETLLSAFYNSGVRGVVGTLPNADTMASYQMLTAVQTVQIHSHAMDSSFGDGLTYPYKLQTCPIASFEGMVLQHMICNYFHWSKIAIFATSDSTGTKSAGEAMSGDYCSLTVLSYQSFQSDTVNFEPYIAAAQQSGAQIFVFFMSQQNAANLLEQGHNAGLFHQGTQVLASNASISAGIKSFFSKKANIPAIMKGVVTVQLWPDYTIQRTPQGKSFRKRFGAMASTAATTDVNGNTFCSSALDDSANTYLYRNPANSKVCAGLNYAIYKAEGSPFSAFASQTYDAVYMLAMGFDTLINHKKTINTQNLMNALYNVSFVGASGLVSVERGYASNSFYNQGDRESGLYYRIFNFNAQVYKRFPNNPFTQIAMWNNELGVFPCTQDMGCMYAAVYNSADGSSFVSDTRPNVIVVMPPASQYLLIVIGIIVLLCAAFLGVLVHLCKHTRIIKVAQPVMVNFILIGEVMAAIRIIIAGMPITDASCAAGLWFGHFAFMLMFGALAMKTWRVNRILNNESMNRIIMTTTDAIIMMAIILGVTTLYLILLTAVGKPHQSAARLYANNQFTLQVRCAFVYPQFHTTLFVLEALVIAVVIWLCWTVKDVPDAVNESKFLVFSLVMMAALAFAAVFLINIPPALKQLIASLFFALAALFSMGILLGGKVKTLIAAGELRRSGIFVDRRKIAASSTSGFPSNSSKGSFRSESSANSDDIVLDTSDAIIASTVDMKNMTVEAKTKMCSDQMWTWRALMFEIHCDTPLDLKTHRTSIFSNGSTVRKHRYEMSQGSEGGSSKRMMVETLQAVMEKGQNDMIERAGDEEESRRIS